MPNMDLYDKKPCAPRQGRTALLMQEVTASQMLLPLLWEISDVSSVCPFLLPCPDIHISSFRPVAPTPGCRFLLVQLKFSLSPRDFLLLHPSHPAPFLHFSFTFPFSHPPPHFISPAQFFSLSLIFSGSYSLPSPLLHKSTHTHT